MQHKRKAPTKAILCGLILLILAATTITLASTPMPAPKQPIEKQLDAQALLDSTPN